MIARPGRGAEMPDFEDRALFMIGVAAELAGMHPQTLRMYERRGLVRPSRSKGGTRLYSRADVARLQRIQEMSETGLNLAGIERVLELERSLEAALERARSLEAQLLAQSAAAMRELDAMRRSLSTEIVPARRGGPPVPLVQPIVRRR
jgi:MerR family transcriptional regulator/heat shock protein HspR